jgi:hypothetical protein
LRTPQNVAVLGADRLAERLTRHDRLRRRRRDKDGRQGQNDRAGDCQGSKHGVHPLQRTLAVSAQRLRSII